ncbi:MULTISPECIES: hypothetical protein [unclassified Methylocaldum]|jgi:hypothetical protein|uniref:hypothetical protein n=1 Tax=unclassified Methylocaldum TaxID=2622260 RepID=UPI000A323B33|nr:hypothetical protein [Methylocaldum sp. RMAD-M]MBP1151317.1 hypothetical protein [Methylocaldum sp. RMAD-M]MVF24197.1 hypothetical protein [Methylocaldum sp. BRCS4]
MPKQRAVSRSPSWTAWLNRRRNKTRIHLLDADWPGLRQSGERIAECLDRNIDDPEGAAIALDRVLAAAWTAYLKARNQRSSTDHDRLIAFVQTVCEALRAVIPSEADDVALIQSFLPEAYGWILKLPGAEPLSGTAPVIEGFGDEPPGTKRTMH